MSSFANPFSIASQTAALHGATKTHVSSSAAAADTAPTPCTSVAASVSSAEPNALQMSAETMRLLQATGRLPPSMASPFGAGGAFPPPGFAAFGDHGGGLPPSLSGNATLSPLDFHRLNSAMGAAASFGMFPMPPELKAFEGLPPHLMGMGHPGLGSMLPPPQTTLSGCYFGPMSPFPGPYGGPYGGGGPLDLNGARRKNATRETTAALKAWLYEHRKNPYPTKGEKIMLAIITKMTLTQVSTWFANARRRLKKENKMTWSPRNRVDEDDDDELGGGERPSSSLSDESDVMAPPAPHHLFHPNPTAALPPPPHGCNATTLSTDVTRKEGNNNELTKRHDGCEAAIDHQADKLSVDECAVKKRKIWSIADTVSTSSSVGGWCISEKAPLPEQSRSSFPVDATVRKRPLSVATPNDDNPPSIQRHSLPQPSTEGAPGPFSFSPYNSPLMSPNAAAAHLLSVSTSGGQFRPELFLRSDGAPGTFANGTSPFSHCAGGALLPTGGVGLPAAALAGLLGQAAFNPRLAAMFREGGVGGSRLPATSSALVGVAPPSRVMHNGTPPQTRVTTAVGGNTKAVDNHVKSDSPCRESDSTDAALPPSKRVDEISS